MDRAFETLLISIALHALVYWGYDKIPVPPPPPTPTEVTLIEKPAAPVMRERQRHIITETEEKPERQPDIKKEADFLSQFTRRVQKQLQAKLLDDTKNAAKKQASRPRREEHVAGQERPDKGELNFEKKKREAMLTGGQIGESSVQEIIPGVETANMTVLNTDKYLYYAFYQRTYEQVRNRWVPGIRGYVQVMTPKMQEKLAARNRTTIVEIMLTPEGQLFRTIVQESSGDKGLDEVAVDAIKKAVPFNHPPQEMVKADGFIHYYASFTILFRPPGFGPAG